MKHIEKTHRLGLLLPSSNSTQEPEFARMLPASVSLHANNMTVWHALKKIGRRESVPGFGQLLRDMPALRKADLCVS
jgi:maleate cis-trans isomerase